MPNPFPSTFAAYRDAREAVTPQLADAETLRFTPRQFWREMEKCWNAAWAVAAVRATTPPDDGDRKHAAADFAAFGRGQDGDGDSDGDGNGQYDFSEVLKRIFGGR